jgi:Leucine-rich repeat (LRR) protein
VVLLAISSGLEALNVNCDFYVTSTETFGPLSKPYQCRAKDHTVDGHVAVDNVIGTHVTGKTNDDVKLISMKKIKCERMPKGFGKFFPNAEGIFAFSTGMKTLVKEDLEPFSKLKYVDFSSNKIDTLPSNLFEKNTGVEWIDFSDNYLRNVGVNVLIPLTKLNYADFQGNRCVVCFRNIFFD